MKLRLAVVQLHYRLAFNDEGWTPLEEPSGSHEKSKGFLDAWSALTFDGPRALRERIRRACCDQLLKRIHAVVTQCAEWGVNVVVFPEYSVPWEVLPELAKVAPRVVVVAGSHTVEAGGLKSGVYRDLAWSRVPVRGSAVCPVLHGERLIGLQPKLGPAPNLELHLEAGGDWQPISLPGSSDTLGVLICIDFLHRESDSHRSLVGPRLDACAFLAVPSFTPARSLSEFMGEADTESKRYKRPVLYCNSAEHGGTTIRVDARFAGSAFPDVIGTLQADEEGVVVADVDFTPVAAGPSTRFSERPQVTPYAAASFVYGGKVSEAAYASWIQGGQQPSEEASLLDYLEARPAPVGGPASRVARLARLRSGLGDLSFERMRQLTREVLLPPDALPLELVNAAVSLGAAAQVREWTKTSSSEELATAEVGLRGAGKAASPESLNDWSATARMTIESIVARVRDRAVLRDRSQEPISAAVSTYLEVVDGQFSARHAQIAAMFEKQAFEEAAEQWATLAADAHRLVEADPAPLPARVWEAKFNFNRAAALFNLQEFERGEEALEGVDSRLLPPNGRLSLATMLLHLGRRDAALLLREQLKQEGADTREFDQLLAIHDGAVECPDDASESVKLELARRLWDMHDFEHAAELALGVSETPGERGMFVLGALSTLVACLTATIFERPLSGRAIPRERRAAVLEAIDAGLKELRNRGETLPGKLRGALREIEVVYSQLTLDRERMRELKAEGAPEPLAAWSQAKDGDLGGALAALKPEEPAWLYHLQRAELFADFGTRSEALAELEPVRGKGPIEYLRAQLLLFSGDFAAALAAAEVAMAELPIRRHKLLLAKVLTRVGEPARAWDLLAGFRSSSDAETLATLAIAAESVEPHSAGQYWQRFIDVEPNDVGARVRLAVLLWRDGEVRRASELGADTINRFGDTMSAEQIVRCARLQMHGTEEATRRQRINDAIDLLETRFRGDPQAEALRFGLIQLIDPTLKSHAVDFGLLEATGAVFTAPSDVVGNWVAAATNLIDRAGRLYRAGGLSLAAFCDAVGVALPMEVARRATQDLPEFCGPIMLLGGAEALAPGARILISPTELYLLAFLGALERLKEHVRDGHVRLVFTPGTQASVLAAHSEVAAVLPHETAVDLAARVHAFVASLLAQGTPEAKPLEEVEVPPTREGADAELVEAWVRSPLRSHFAIRSLMEVDDRLLRVTADMFGSDVLGVAETLMALQWDQSALQTQFARNRLTSSRDLSVATLLRHLFSGETLRELLVRLARLGFQDALGAQELEWLITSRADSELQEVLRRSDWVARDEAHLCYESANHARLHTYSEAVWTLLAPRRPLAAAVDPAVEASIMELGKQQAASAILDAVESMDPECRYGVLQRFAQMIGVESVGKLKLFYLPSDERHVVFDEKAPAARFWGWFSDWAGLRSIRRRAVIRGLQDALVSLDQLGPVGGLPRPQSAPLVFAAKRMSRRPAVERDSGGVDREGDDHFGLHELSGQTLAILSATWDEKPLAGQGIVVSRADVEVGRLDYEETIVLAGRSLGRSANLVTDGALLDFVVDVGGTSVRADLSLEAAFLRLDDERVREGFAPLAALQGPLDGQLYDALIALGASPSIDARRHYAQLSCTALFRRVRHDPTFLVRWATTRDRTLSRPTLQLLRHILSEPNDIVENERLFKTVGARIQTGAWSTRADRDTLSRWVLEMPGEMAAVRAWHSLEVAGQVPALVEAALDRVRHSDEQPICRVASDVFFLRAAVATTPVVALSAGEVDLRTELPEVFSRLLRSEADRARHTARPAPSDAPDVGVGEATALHRVAPTFADAEPRLLRVCAQVVRSLRRGPGRGSSVSAKEELWLVYRLYQWLYRQLGVLATEAAKVAVDALAAEAQPVAEPLLDDVDAFDPRRFESSVYPYRLVVALYAVGTSAFEKQRPDVRPARSSLVSSDQMERLLAELAGGPEGPELDTVFDWLAPLTIPRLALSMLLATNRAGVLALSEQAQLEWISRIPSSLDEGPEARWIVWSQLIEALATSRAMRPAVREALRRSVEALHPGRVGTQVREIGTVLLYESGSDELELSAREAVLARICRGVSSASLFGRFLCGLVRRAPEQVEAAMDQALARLDALPGDHEASASELVAVGLGLLLTSGPPATREQTRATLLRFVERPRFRLDPRLVELVQFTGGRAP